MEHPNWKKKNPGNYLEYFFMKMHQFKKKNPPKFEKAFKMTETVKS